MIKIQSNKKRPNSDSNLQKFATSNKGLLQISNYCKIKTTKGFNLRSETLCRFHFVILTYLSVFGAEPAFPGLAILSRIEVSASMFFIL